MMDMQMFLRAITAAAWSAKVQGNWSDVPKAEQDELVGLMEACLAGEDDHHHFNMRVARAAVDEYVHHHFNMRVARAAVDEYVACPKAAAVQDDKGPPAPPPLPPGMSFDVTDGAIK